LRRRRLAFLTDLGNDLRAAVRRERVRRGRRAPASPNGHGEAAAEVKRRLDATRERLRGDIPPRED